MKIEETKQSQSQLLEEALTESQLTTEQIEDAYEDIRILKEVMNSGNFMLLIQENRAMHVDDISRIHATLHHILESNEILASAGMSVEYDGRSTLTNLGNRFYKGLNALFSFSLTGRLGWAAVATVSLPVSVLAAAGAAVFAAAGITNVQALNSVKKASEIMAISDLIADSKPVVSATKRNAFQRTWDSIRRKTPREIQLEAREKAERNARKAQEDLEDAISHLPETVQYIDRDNRVKEYPVVYFFARDFVDPRDVNV